MRAISIVLVACACLARTPCARAVASMAEDEPRLIGWMGEVHRPPASTNEGAREAPDGTASGRASLTMDASSVDGPERREDARGEDGAPRVTVLSWSPRAFLYSNFLSDEECEHLIKLGESHLERSTVVGGAGEGEKSNARTSFGTFVTRRLTPTLRAVEDRVAEYSGIPWEHQEQLQLLRYENGQEYVAHHDGIVSQGNGEKRIATVLMFLREPEFGGETNFPSATPLEETKARFIANKDKFSKCGWNNGEGFSLIPKKGDALLFFSFHINGTSDVAAQHASCPTLRGVKYTATKWIHEQEFSTGTYVTPTCTNERKECDMWAESGECETNPLFMMGTESVGACSKSCCARDRSKLSEIQLTFCEPCDAIR